MRARTKLESMQDIRGDVGHKIDIGGGYGLVQGSTGVVVRFLCVINHTLFAISLLDEKALQGTPSADSELGVNLCLGHERGAKTLFLLFNCSSKDVLEMERRP